METGAASMPQTKRLTQLHCASANIFVSILLSVVIAVVIAIGIVCCGSNQTPIPTPVPIPEPEPEPDPIPQRNMVFTHLQNTPGWGSCADTACAGGANATSFPMVQFVSTPSLSGSSAEFSISGPPFADALHWIKFPPEDWATNYQWEFWVYFDDNSLTAQAMEFDIFTAIAINGTNRKFMFGSQCNYNNGLWQGWSEQTGHWIDTSVPCTKFTPNVWHRVILHVRRTGANLDQCEYVSLIVDNNKYQLSIIESSEPTNWNEVIGVQFQQDIGASGTGFSEYVDNVTLTIW
jgi:hypothetical protein